jgi:predicted RNA-binding Zn ribbon-like protein
VSDLNVVGGHVALDLVNTVEPRVPGATDGNDHLQTPQDLLAWALRLALVSADEADQVRDAWASGDRGDSAYAASIEVREAMYAVLLAELGVLPDAQPALEVLARHWARAIGRSSLSLTPVGGLAAASDRDRLLVGTEPEWLVPDRLAHAAVELLRTMDERQLKTCPLEDGGCGWVFLDRSRNGSRRWCSMSDCGARAKSRRLTDRRRSARGPRAPQTVTGASRSPGAARS